MDKTHFISGVFDIYDERLLESRLTEEGNVCGALLKDLTSTFSTSSAFFINSEKERP